MISWTNERHRYDSYTGSVIGDRRGEIPLSSFTVLDLPARSRGRAPRRRTRVPDRAVRVPRSAAGTLRPAQIPEEQATSLRKCSYFANGPGFSGRVYSGP